MENRVCPVPPHFGMLRAKAPVPVSPPVTCIAAGTCPVSMLWLLPPSPSQNPSSHRLLPTAVDKCRLGGSLRAQGKLSHSTAQKTTKKDLRHYSPKFLAPPCPHFSHWLTFLIFPRPSWLVPIFLKSLLCPSIPTPISLAGSQTLRLSLLGWTDPCKLLQAALS